MILTFLYIQVYFKVYLNIPEVSVLPGKAYVPSMFREDSFHRLLICLWQVFYAFYADC